MVVAQAVPVADDNTDILQHIRVLLHISDRYEYISDELCVGVCLSIHELSLNQCSGLWEANGTPCYMVLTSEILVKINQK